jgi:hypothetical protein
MSFTAGGSKDSPGDSVPSHLLSLLPDGLNLRLPGTPYFACPVSSDCAFNHFHVISFLIPMKKSFYFS